MPIPKEQHDIKELFEFLTSAGAGRPVDQNGFPKGGWSPESLALEISNIKRNSEGVELRTVQLWFQDNDKGISSHNIRWLARIFGCNDPIASSEWQAALAAANRRLASKRKGQQSNRKQELSKPDNLQHSKNVKPEANHEKADTKKISLAKFCDEVFSKTVLHLPATIFGGATGLIFLSNLIGNHSVIFPTPDGVGKQVGFLWAPNWTMVFILLLPAFVLIASEVLIYWKAEGRDTMLRLAGTTKPTQTWSQYVEGNGYTYWLVFIICVLFAGIVQWLSAHLLPLLRGSVGEQMDWASIAVERPEIVSIPEALIFSCLSYVYMGICLFILFVGLILLVTIAQDYWRLEKTRSISETSLDSHEASQVGFIVMSGIFRCTVLGLLIAICIKMQEAYMESAAPDIALWLYSDALAFFGIANQKFVAVGYNLPNHMESLLLGLAVCFVYVYSAFRVKHSQSTCSARLKMAAVVGFLIMEYLVIGAFQGFTLFITFGILVALYSLFNPQLGFGNLSNNGAAQNV